MRYLVFEYDGYYPSGGMTDCTFKTNDREEALAKARDSQYDYSEVYDTATGEEVS
jgi:hypothetical protein